MLVTVERSGTSPRPVADLLEWCQSGPSRAHWPGVARISWDDGPVVSRLFYEVAVAAPGAPPGQASVEEHMCRPEEEDDGVYFESSQLWTWEGGQVSGAWATYRFAEHEGAGARLRFVFRYLLGDLGDPGVFRRDEFSASIAAAVERYVAALVVAGSPLPAAAGPTEAVGGRRRRVRWVAEPGAPTVPRGR